MAQLPFTTEFRERGLIDRPASLKPPDYRHAQAEASNAGDIRTYYMMKSREPRTKDMANWVDRKAAARSLRNRKRQGSGRLIYPPYERNEKRSKRWGRPERAEPRRS
jgi:hypothetical protein